MKILNALIIDWLKNLTADDIEQTLNTTLPFGYLVPKTPLIAQKDDWHGFPVPKWNSVFQQMIIENRTLPSPEEFANKYISNLDERNYFEKHFFLFRGQTIFVPDIDYALNEANSLGYKVEKEQKNKIKIMETVEIDSDDLRNGLYIRSLRNYPSFVREIHLYPQLVELAKKYNLNIIYDIDLDNAGWDFIIRDSNQKDIMAICTFINTTFARGMNMEKSENRRTHSKSRPYMELTANPNYNIKGIYLYGQDDIHIIESKLLEYL